MPKVLIVDDEQSARDAFSARHQGAGWFVSAFVGEPRGLCAYLESLRRKELPDLLVLDLYTTNSPPGSPDAAKVNAEVEDHIKAIDERIKVLGEVVARGKKPLGMDMLKAVRGSRRRAVRSLPVMLFTRQGLALLSDDELKVSHEKDATWMVKNRTPDLERAAMTHALSHGPRLARDIAIGSAFLILGLILAPPFQLAFEWLTGASR